MQTGDPPVVHGTRAWRGKRPGRLFPGACIAILVLVAGCGQQGAAPRPGDAETPRDGGTFAMAQDSPDRIDPACVDDVYEATLVNQIFDGLLAFDTHLNTIPCIASSWVISPDGRTYTFRLRDDARFHDGKPVTSTDVVYSLTRVFDLPEEQAGLARQYLCHIRGSADYAARRTESINGLEAPSPTEVRIALDHAYAPFLAVLASEMTRIVPKHYVEQVGDEEFARNPIGSGPFRLAERNQSRIVLVAARDQPNVHAHLDSLVFVIPNEDWRDYAPREFLAGHLDAALVPEGRLAEFRRQAGTQVLTRHELSLSFLGLNPLTKPFDDQRVRRAFAHAIDRDAILAHDPSTRIPPNGILPPGMPGYTPESKLIPYDPEAAASLLQQAGYPHGKGLPPVRFTFAMRSESGRILVQQIRDQVERVGFRFVLEELSWADFSARLDSKRVQCLNVTWVADIPDPDSFLYPMCASDGSANFHNYSNSSVDSLLVLGRARRSSQERLAIYRNAERQTLLDATVIPLYHPLTAMAVRSAVRGFTISPMGVGSLAMETVWLANAPRSEAAALTVAMPSPPAPAARGSIVLEGRVP
jgi:peptide/nickel transport system substrate-binding protein/oligopeptide transport system substrate-binding protein